MCEPVADAPHAAGGTAAAALVRRSVAEVEGMCTPALSAECGRSSGRGCPYPVSSSAALQHSPAVEACIRMGYWWNRQYCKGDLRRPPYNRGLHYVNASSGRHVKLRSDVFPAWKVATFKNRLWPFAIAAESGVQVAINPTDSIPPGHHRCVPVLVACRVAASAQNRNYSRDDPHFGDVLWPGSTLGFGSLSQQSSAFYDDVPWANKTSRIAWRGAATGCWDTARACPNRDIPGTVPAHASRFAAWQRLRASGLADIAFSGPPSKYDLAGNAWARAYALGAAAPQLARLSPDRFDARRAALHLTAAFGTLANESRGLCQHEECPPWTKKARMGPAELSRYKIILQVDGESFPSSAAWTHLTSSAVMAPASSYDTYADIGMRPWRHFIPTALDFSDAERNARWCFDHDRECEAIGRAGREHMLRIFDASKPPGVGRRPGGGRDEPLLRLSRFERKVEEIIIAHLVANARPC